MANEEDALVGVDGAQWATRLQRAYSISEAKNSVKFEVETPQSTRTEAVASNMVG